VAGKVYICIKIEIKTLVATFLLMTEQERLDILEAIHLMKVAYEIHTTQNIIKDPIEREKYLFEIIDTIQELESKLKEDPKLLN
jgi:hypothetical protein